MKKIVLALLLLCCSYPGFSYNGCDAFMVPSNLVAGSFSTNYAKLTFNQQHQLLISSAGAGLIVYDGTNFQSYHPGNSGIASYLVTECAVNAANHYFAVSDSGMSEFDGLNWFVYNQQNSALTSNRLARVSSAGTDVLVGGFEGITHFSSGNSISYSTLNSALSNDTINGISYDLNNDYWIATSNGLNKFSNGTISSFNTSNSSIPGNKIISVHARGNALWMFISGIGIVRYANGIFEPLKELISTCLTLNFAPAICDGPNGGVIFMEPNGRYFCEFADGRLKTYFFQNFINFTGLNSLAFDAASNQLFMSSVSKRLGSIDFDNYVPSLSSFNISPAATPTRNSENSQNLDANQVNAGILNLGDLFNDGSNPRYEVPKNSGKHSIYAASLWIGGLSSNNNLHLAAQTYRQNGTDYWPGPLDTVAGFCDTAKATQYNRIWKLNKQDIDDFISNFALGNVQNGSYIPAEAILSWPATETGNYAHKLASFVDVNQDGIYNPIVSGDYPLIRGDQQLFWIFNDNLAAHTEADGLPMKVEVHASAYSFQNGTSGGADTVLKYSTFFHYDIFNRSSENYDSCRIGNWIDFDLGNSIDDKVGSFVNRNLVYCYNGDSLDEGTSGAYGANPPIISAKILQGPPAYPNDGIDNNHDGTIDEAAELNGMASSILYNNDFTLTGNPVTTAHYWSYLNARWKDNSPLTLGQNGYGGSIPQQFIYPDRPDSAGGWTQSLTNDGRMVQACGPFHLGAGQSVSYDYAYIFSRHPNLTYNSAPYYDAILSDADQVQNWFNQQILSNNNSVYALNLNAEKITLQLYPNPGTGKFAAHLSNGNKIKSLRILNSMGAMVKENLMQQGFEGSLPAGIYLVEARDAAGKIYRSKWMAQ